MNLVRLLPVLAVFLPLRLCVNPQYLPLQSQLPGLVERDEIIERYFLLGFNYVEILAFLALCHGIFLSLRQLKRILRQRSLRRRGQPSNGWNVIAAVENELNGSGSSIGYRLMHQRLRIDYGLQVDRETVRQVLKALDPEGVEARSKRKLQRRKYRSKGPDFIWHIDGYDKLKPFGFCIHGAIDGYSRRILWLKVGFSNNDPWIIASYFIKYVRLHEKTATVIRGDCGTENTFVARAQQHLRANHDDSFASDKSFLYGRSVSNQRIEAWWSFLRKTETNWWINFFKDLREQGIYSDDDPVQVECLKFCFMPLIQEELDRVAVHWNLHKIRPSSNEESPSGRPDVLYFLPELSGSRSRIQEINMDDIEDIQDMLNNHTHVSRSVDFAELANLIMEDEGLSMPETADEALELYALLVSSINDLM